MADPAHINSIADHLFREHSGKMTAVLCRIFGLQHLDSIQDVVHDTFLEALTRWRYRGIPKNPEAWLLKVAKNKAVNAFKRDGKTTLYEPSAFGSNHQQLIEAKLDHSFEQQAEDSQMRLLLLCCHPGISAKNQVMLTLHILGGFGITEIARAILMQQEAVKKALQRSKSSLKAMDNMLQTSILAGYEKRIEVVHTVLYLMFNEGYKTTQGKELINRDLCLEAVRLSKLLLRKGVSRQHETMALLALMLFNLARFASRITGEGSIIELSRQNRKLWDQALIEKAYRFLDDSTRPNQLSRYHLEAIIASLHCAAPSFEETDWSTIAYLYRQLEKITFSPLTTLNRLVAESYSKGVSDSYHQLEALMQQPLPAQQQHIFYAAKGDFLRRLNQTSEAVKAYHLAISCSPSPSERNFLEDQIAKCKKSIH